MRNMLKIDETTTLRDIMERCGDDAWLYLHGHRYKVRIWIDSEGNRAALLHRQRGKFVAMYTWFQDGFGSMYKKFAFNDGVVSKKLYAHTIADLTAIEHAAIAYAMR